MAIKRKLPQRDLDAAMAWLVRLNSPALTPAEETQFFVWLEASPVHQAAYLKAEQLWLRGDVLAQARKPAASRHLLWLWGGAAAACMALQPELKSVPNPLNSHPVHSSTGFCKER